MLRQSLRAERKDLPTGQAGSDAVMSRKDLNLYNNVEPPPSPHPEADRLFIKGENKLV